MAPGDHSVDSILHWDLQLEGGLAGPRGVILTGERGRAQLASAPEEEAVYEGALPQAWPTDLLTLPIRSSRSPSMALGETS